MGACSTHCAEHKMQNANCGLHCAKEAGSMPVASTLIILFSYAETKSNKIPVGRPKTDIFPRLSKASKLFEVFRSFPKFFEGCPK